MSSLYNFKEKKSYKIFIPEAVYITTSKSEYEYKKKTLNILLIIKNPF